MFNKGGGQNSASRKVRAGVRRCGRAASGGDRRHTGNTPAAASSSSVRDTVSEISQGDTGPRLLPSEGLVPLRTFPVMRTGQHLTFACYWGLLTRSHTDPCPFGTKIRFSPSTSSSLSEPACEAVGLAFPFRQNHGASGSDQDSKRGCWHDLRPPDS